MQRSAELCGRKASQTKSKKDKKGALEGLGLEPGLVCPTVLLLMIYDQVATSRKPNIPYTQIMVAGFKFLSSNPGKREGVET